MAGKRDGENKRGGSSHDRAMERAKNPPSLASTPSGMPTESGSAKSKSLPQAIVWLRTFGGAGVLLGGIGVIQMPILFWWGIGCVYFGFALLLVDLFCENFSLKAKIPAAFLLIVVMFVFTTNVVLRPESLSELSVDSDGKTTVMILNDSDDDYTNLDVKLSLLNPKAFIEDVKQGDPQVPLIIYPALPNGELSDTGDSVEVPIGSLIHPGNTDPASKPIANVLRIHCDKLPKRTQLVIKLTLRGNDHPKSLRVLGEFYGKFRKYPVDDTVSVMQP